MSDYSQPDFYRFNEDSLKLVKWVISKVTDAHAILDLGAGSGIIGIELANHFEAQTLTCVEVQEDYRSHLENNLQHFLNKNTATEMVFESFSNWCPSTRFDLIVSNPPYYLPGHGQRPRDERKELARSFVRDNWNVFLNTISGALSENGRAFLVIKNDKRILNEIQKSGTKLLVEFHEEGDLIFLELSRLNVD